MRLEFYRHKSLERCSFFRFPIKPKLKLVGSCVVFTTTWGSTVFAYVYNFSYLIRKIRGHDHSNSSSEFTDDFGRQINFKGDHIDLSGFTDIYHGLTEE
jgi:hypothetical protein